MTGGRLSRSVEPLFTIQGRLSSSREPSSTAGRADWRRGSWRSSELAGCPLAPLSRFERSVLICTPNSRAFFGALADKRVGEMMGMSRE